MSAQVTARLQTMRVLWMGLVVSVVAYDVILVQLRKDPHEHPTDLPPHLPELLAVLAVAVAVTSFVLPRKLFTAGLAQVQIAVAEEPGEVVGSFRESAPVKRVVTNPEQAVLGALAKLQAPFIVGMALCESIALFGLMLGFIGESMRLAVVFFLVALALMALRYPRLATVTQAVERSSNAKCTL